MKQTTLFGLLAATLMAGCGSDHSDDNRKSLSQDASELEAYLKQGVIGLYIDGSDMVSIDDDAAVSPEAGDSGGDTPDFSTTNTQESGVDEADLIKQNGDYLFAVQQPTFYWPDVVATLDSVALDNPAPPEQNSGHIEIYRTETSPVRSHKVGSYPVTNSSQIDGLYLLDDQLVSLSQGYIETAKGPVSDSGTSTGVESVWDWRDYHVDIQLLDISTPDSPQQAHRLQIEGSLISSRRIGNELYLATRFTPDIQWPEEGEVTDVEWNNQIVEQPLADFLPRVWTNGEESGHLFTDGQCHLPDLNQGGYPGIVAVVRVNLEDPTDWEAQCNSGRIHGVYASADAFVIMGYPNNQWDATRLDLYDLSTMTLKATGSLPGTLQSSMPSFRISEKDGLLRVVTSSDSFAFIDDIAMVDGTALDEATQGTTQETSAQNDWDHRLFILEPNANQGFNLISSLPNEQRPDAIGKPNEHIQSIRFRGDRAYVVTFLQTDPLYVLNLSDSHDPFIEGELEIEGFSAYLEPISDDLLLGVGRAATNSGQLRGLKVSLFDTSNPAIPTEITSYELGERWADSSALWDHHALSFLPMDGKLRVAFTWQGYDNDWNWAGNQIHVADIDIAQRSIEQTLNARYETPDQHHSSAYHYGYTRVPLHSDGLHLVNNGNVTSGPLSQWQSQP